MIKLVNIDLTGVNIREQGSKAFEEMCEYEEAKEEGNREHIIEEFFDMIQAELGLQYLRFGITAEEVMEHYPKHLEKLKNRPRD